MGGGGGGAAENRAKTLRDPVGPDPGAPRTPEFGRKSTNLVRHRVGFTGGLFWTGLGFRLFFSCFFGSRPVQIGSWVRKHPKEPI